MTSTQKKGIPSERVCGSTAINIDSLECSICRDLLWKPIACQTCETPFCSPCIRQWLVNNPTTCPNRCETYTERKCPPFIAKLLSQLQITCFYQSNGCEQIMSYEALDKHEMQCDYQPKQCPGCQLEMLEKEFTTHKKTCELIELTCEDCQLMYKINEIETKHTEDICLKTQIKLLKQESKENKCEIQKLKSELTELHKLDYLVTRNWITFDDLSSTANSAFVMPNKYRGLKWTKISYIHKSFAIERHPESGYTTSFTPGGSLHIAFFSEEASISIEPPNETFTIVSLSASAAWYDNLKLAITGYRNSIEVHHYSIVLLFGRPQRIALQWKNIDKVIFKPSGGTAHLRGEELSGTYVALTQLVIDDLAERKTNSIRN